MENLEAERMCWKRQNFQSDKNAKIKLGKKITNNFLFFLRERGLRDVLFGS